MIRTRIIVHGRVQGVFFRDSVRQRARAAGIAGWVRNNRDGTVEAVLEGDPASVEAVVAFAQEGPRGARVDRVVVVAEPVESLTGFAVLSFQAGRHQEPGPPASRRYHPHP
ncbi:MAG: acylphosphatase [Acidimicrobiia bacterium]|nr:acylphosphatase [Acidimicrobiia bacterium]